MPENAAPFGGDEEVPEAPAEVIISARRVSFFYGEFQALRDISV